MLAARRGHQLGDRWEDDRRRAEYRRIDRAEEARRIAAEVRDPRGGIERLPRRPRSQGTLAAAGSTQVPARRKSPRPARPARDGCPDDRVGRSSSVASWLSSSVGGM
jgi:hypothetical protein